MRWLGVDISTALTNADSWLNADHRRGFFVAAGAVVASAALGAEAYRLITHRSLGRKIRGCEPVPKTWLGRYEWRFWAVAWIFIALLVEFRLDSFRLLFTLSAVVVAVRGISDLIGTISRPRLPWANWVDYLGEWAIDGRRSPWPWSWRAVREFITEWLSCFGTSMGHSFAGCLSAWLSMPINLPLVLLFVLIEPEVDWPPDEEVEDATQAMDGVDSHAGGDTGEGDTP